MEEKVMLSVQIDYDLRKKLNYKTVEHNTTLREAVPEMIELWIKHKDKQNATKRR